ncbi:unnamed protein product [Triticum turgidum subsp. durum]|uniref:H(+)-transporting two-sector ATPase n=1 Tax=Triticum turgidum subsp. durum TaxID=4567 RepID=A0A9R1RNV2_TRITD|nr:unnamed protein product [Triticum turgidum subsp. durum]
MRTNPTTSPPGASTIEEKSTGRIDQIIGLVLDVTFPPGKLPYIYNALVVQSRDTDDKQINVTCEVQQLLGNNRVRDVAMSATDGLMRGMEVIDTGAPLNSSAMFPIHRSAPAFIELDTKLSIFETGIKVVDLLAPY